MSNDVEIPAWIVTLIGRLVLENESLRQMLTNQTQDGQMSDYESESMT